MNSTCLACISNNATLFKSYLSYVTIKIYGRECVQNRMTAYYGPLDFKYSGQVMPKQAMPEFLNNIKIQLNEFLGTNLNSCLINYYPDGTSNIRHHSDGKRL